MEEIMARFSTALNSETSLLKELKSCDTGVLNLTVQDDPGFFVQVCALGYLDAVRYLKSHCDVDLTVEIEGKTALQWASLHGHTEVVRDLCELYTETDQKLTTPAWKENSAFYLASVGGHMGIIDILMNSFPGEIDGLKDPEVLQVLFYAACKGGHMPVIRRWLRPSLDVNQPLPYISSFQDCEQKIPLLVACEGGHFDVAVLLVDLLHAELKTFIVERFPEFTAQLVDKVYKPVRCGDAEGEVSYSMKHARAHFIHNVWLQPHFNTITHIKLERIGIKRLDSCIPWSFPNLIHLDLSHNSLSALSFAAGEAEGVRCSRLEWVSLAHNKLSDVCLELFQLQSLKYLDLSHNALQRLRDPYNTPSTTGSGLPAWQLYSLLALDLSHNQLDILPGGEDFVTCRSLKRLDLSHNKLCSLRTNPWECPMECLDVSHNQLERFPPTTEVWSGTLTQLYLQHNNLDELGENVVRLGVLTKLNASHNKISHLASAQVWDCPNLSELNLSHNSLGEAQKRDKKNAATVIEFPSDHLAAELRTLNLSDNDLIQLPVSVCFIKNLSSLNISNNPMQDLPPELGHLLECWDLKMEGLKIKKSDLQELVKNGKPVEVIEHLRKQLRKVQSCNILKVFVIGPQGKGKSTVVEALLRANVDKVKLSTQLVTVTTHTLKCQGKFKMKDRSDNDRPDVQLRIWELAGNQELLAFHPVLWTENSLFLLVWDINNGTEGLSLWLCNIGTQLSKVSVVVVVTHKDRLAAADAERKVYQLHEEVNNMYGGHKDLVGMYPKDDPQKVYPSLSAVVFITRQMARVDISGLRSAVYQAALRMAKNSPNPVTPAKLVVGQKLPQSYLDLDRELLKRATELKDQDGRPPCLSQVEFDEIVKGLRSADFDSFDDRQQALNVLNELGGVLHFDVWSEGLRNWYFLDPNWLAKMISTVIGWSSLRGAGAYRQSMNEVNERLVMERLPCNMMGPFLHILKHFDVGAEQEGRFLIPSLLPKSAPGLQLDQTAHGRKLMRFYAMPFVPSRLWSRLILGLIMAMDRFSQSCWHGLEIQKMPQLTFWQEGLNISYSGGFIVIESAVFRSTTNGKQTKGILISILTDSSTLGDLAVIGFVTDELDSALQNTFHDYHENNDLFGIYALCPVCFNVRPCEGVVRGERLHFSLADCAGDLLYDDYIPCEHGNLVDLVNLIPEFLLCELPARLHIVPQELDLKERLGGGAVGTVHKGVWRGEEVAVKLFYQNSAPAQNGAVDLDVVPDSGTSTMSSCGSRDSVVNGNGTECSVYGNFKMLSDSFRARTYDRMDGRNLKVLKAFSELRQEIVILSQLNHPCLISLLGVSVRPSLLVALELAPLGSLRSVLDTRMEGRRFNRYHYQDKDKTFVSVLDKDITFKIVYQVCVGLEYLHERSIVYRDLKPDNILVRSMEARETINIKLSDYGIAKFTTPQGTMGKVGTPGYMAPELMEGQSYNEKVDIFSFSMVIYELLSGHPPFEKCGRLHQIHHIVNVEKKRPSLMEYNVIPNFPFLENMMESMWAHDAHRRPAATALKERMEDVSFLLQHTHLGTPCEVAPAPVARAHTSTASVMDSCGLFWNVTCAWASKENSRAVSVTGRNNCWVWESPSTNIYDRRLSIYNLATGKPQAPICKNCPGLPVTCMAKVGQKMWMGVQGRCIELHDMEHLLEKPPEPLKPVWGVIQTNPQEESQESCQGGSIEIHGCTQTDFNKGRSRVEDLGADPIAIIHDKDNAKAQKLHPDGLGFVYVGLSDGTVLVYHHHSHKRGVFTNEWTRFKTLTITSETRLQALCFLPRQKDLVAACGHSLIIISTDSMLVERRICLLKDVPQHVRDKVGALHTLVKNDDTLWCSFKNSPLILELEVQTWKLTAAYCIEADLEVYVTEVKIASGAGEEGACEECGGRSSFHESSSRSVKEDPTPRPPPRPPRVTKPSVQTDPRPQSPARPPKPDAQTEARTLSPARPPRLTEPSAQADPGPLSPARPPRLTKPSSQADPRPFSPARPPRLTEPSAQADPRPLSPTNITVEVQQPALPPVPRRDLKPSLGTSPGAAETAKMKELEMQGAVFGSVSSRKSSTESASESLISADDETFDNYVSEHYGRRPRSDADLLSSSSSSDLRGLEKSALERKKSNTLPNPSTRRKPPPVPPTPPPPVCRRSLPSEHDGVYVQSLLCVHDALWVGSSCGEILVIGVQKRTTPCPTESPANPRMSLNLDAKQMCNLKSVRMVEDQDKMDPENKRHCGGVHTMVQARNMVVAVRCISQQQDIDEVSVWNACSADRFSLVRQYWCALRPH